MLVLLSFSINGFMKDPIALTRAFSEFDGTTDVDIEESPKFVGD